MEQLKNRDFGEINFVEMPPQSLLDVKFIKPKKPLDIYIYIYIIMNVNEKILTNKINYLKITLFKLGIFDRIVVRYKEEKDEAVFKEKIFRK